VSRNHGDKVTCAPSVCAASASAHFHFLRLRSAFAAARAIAVHVTKPKTKKTRMTARAACLIVAGRGTVVTRACTCGATAVAHELCAVQMVARTWTVFGSFACAACGEAWQQFAGNVSN